LYFNHNQNQRWSNLGGARGAAASPCKRLNTLIEQSVTQNKAHRVVKEIVYEAIET